MENSVLMDILNMTSWRMETPQLSGAFHLTASVLSAILAAAAAVLFARRIKTEQGVIKTLAASGWILAVLEVYKQLFLFFVVNGGAFDFWFFPFQLCSVPMYLCILMPVLGKKARAVLTTFMGGYAFVSAAATLIFPEDILRPYIALTIHGFVWHGLLLFISLLIVMTGLIDSSFSGIRKASGFFIILCVIAVGINMLAEPVMPAIRAAHPSVAHSWTAMFYLNPYHISPQPVVSTVQESAGIPAGLILYVIAITAAGSTACYALSRVLHWTIHRQNDKV